MANVKNDASQLPKSSDHAEILKQVEFYFSDNNLPYDKFLWTSTSKNDGWIPIKTVHSFKRMQRFEPFDEVVAALRESKDMLEVSEDGEQVRRKSPLKLPPAGENKSRFARTVYAKGFGEETASSQYDIENFFSKFGQFNQVRLRRTEDGQFKSSVFAEFSMQEDATKFVEQDPKPKFNDLELLVMSKQAYVEMKSEQHNFADCNNGRRKPKFNAYKEMRAQEFKNKKRNDGKAKRDFKRNHREDESGRDGVKSDNEKKADSEEKPESKEKPKSEGKSQSEENVQSEEKVDVETNAAKKAKISE